MRESLQLALALCLLKLFLCIVDTLFPFISSLLSLLKGLIPVVPSILHTFVFVVFAGFDTFVLVMLRTMFGVVISTAQDL
jgi:hypothetical protein